MAWTYSADFTQPLNKVRLLLGDIVSTEQLCSDEEAAFALEEESGNAYRAAAFLADRLAARYAGDEAVSGDGLSLSGAGRAASYRTLAANLRAEALRRGGSVAASAAGGGAVVLTGVRLSGMAAAEADTDRVKPAFVRESPLPPGDEVLL